MDVDGWKRILTSRQFGQSSTGLWATIALIKQLCIDKDLANTFEAFLSCRLIPLDKDQGLPPIGAGEMLRRIGEKVIVSTLRNDISTSVGPLQKFVQDKMLGVKLSFVLYLKCVKRCILKQLF